ncbi:MAG TPA: CocE/NonD family hydrolase [Gemmatimonadaceae bacterium]|nr:CocE/NonD family hydrolase [Gemmatimonadaceae bacterium]
MHRSTIIRGLAVSVLVHASAPCAHTQQIKVPATARVSDSAFIAWLPQLARIYTPPNVDNRMRGELVAGDYQRALADIAEMGSPPLTVGYEVYAATQLAGGPNTLSRVFAERTRRLDNRTTAHQLRYAMGTSLVAVRRIFQISMDSLKTKDSLTNPEAVDVIRRYASLLTYELLAPNSEDLLAEDDARRYVITRDILVKTRRGGIVCVLVVRPRNLQGKQTALLNFTVYESDNTMVEARRSASNGYVGVEGLTRGKGCSPNKPVSHEYDGIDAAALIDWIARQPWSDGRVGMYGGSYDGFTQWAAAKHRPKALKAMMPPVTHAPGIDFPIDGNVFMSYAYPWPFYTTNKKGLDSATYTDTARWARMNAQWYKSGRAYKDLPLIDGTPNPIFLRWLSHPGYDAYWQNMIPYTKEFAEINIPILTTTGYFDGGQMGALWYFRQQMKYAPKAEHYLLIGPYDHASGQRGTVDPLGRRVVTNIQNVELDSASNIDLGELRYQWFNYVFKGAPRPAILADRVNYEVMGGNEWKHAPTIDAMHSTTMRVTLGKSVVQVVDLADRTDVERWGVTGDLLDPSSGVRNLVDTATNIANSFMFSSPVIAEGGEVSGLFSGKITFVTNKKDFDYSVTLFELTKEGKYLQLNYYWSRASYAKDRSARMLLAPGKRTTLAFENNRLTSKQIEKGSRIVVVIAVMKNPSQQINYGSGKTVADETIKDAGEKLRIEWLPATFVDVPFTPP